MAESLKLVRARIRSIENTRKITNAMEMVSSSKYKKTDMFLHPARNYFEKLEQIFTNVIRSSQQITDIFRRKKEGHLLICVIASDAGLCSTYNNNVFMEAESFIKMKKEKNSVRILPIGKKAYAYFKQRGYEIVSPYLDTHGRFSLKLSDDLLLRLMHYFLKEKEDVREIFSIYTLFKGPLKYAPTVEQLFPIPFSKRRKYTYIEESNIEDITEQLISMYTSAKIRLMLLEAFTSEHSARTMSMQMATDNASELMENLIIRMNKTRQAAITREVIEIISSAEALKG